MSPESQAAVSELDAALDRTPVSVGLADEVFAVVDLVDGSPTIRRALTDPSTPADRRQALASHLLQGRVGAPTIDVVRAAVGGRHAGSRLADALERQGVRALLKTAQADGQLDNVEDQLFRFGRLVDSDSDLRLAVTDRRATVQRRQSLIETLLQSKAQPQTIRLAQRAVLARDRTFQRTLGGYVALAASMQDRVIATVRVARALDQSQRERLQSALARQLGREVALQEVIEPQLLGGVRVEFGDEVIEGTVAARLNQARRQFGKSAI